VISIYDFKVTILTPKGFFSISPGFPILGYRNYAVFHITLKGLRLSLIPYIPFIIFDFVLVEKTKEFLFESFYPVVLFLVPDVFLYCIYLRSSD